jgi:hypothetical protein
MASPLRLKEGLPWVVPDKFPNLPSKQSKAITSIPSYLSDPSKKLRGLNE